MHDIGRTQLEHQAFGEYSGSELEGSEYESGEYESGEYESGETEFGEYESGELGELESGELGEAEGTEFGEFEGAEQEGSGISPELESPLSEMEEMELASELLELTSEQELEQFLSDVFRTVGQAAGNFM